MEEAARGETLGSGPQSEYWYFALFRFLVTIVALVFVYVLSILGSLLFMAVVLGTFLPHVAVSVRRLHDVNKSGWWYLLSFVPLGGLLLFVWAVTDGTSGPNQFGADPKGAPASVASAVAEFD